MWPTVKGDITCGQFYIHWLGTWWISFSPLVVGGVENGEPACVIAAWEKLKLFLLQFARFVENQSQRNLALFVSDASRKWSIIPGCDHGLFMKVQLRGPFIA
jgi:hypothetical protein